MLELEALVLSVRCHLIPVVASCARVHVTLAMRACVATCNTTFKRFYAMVRITIIAELLLV